MQIVVVGMKVCMYVCFVVLSIVLMFRALQPLSVLMCACVSPDELCQLSS